MKPKTSAVLDPRLAAALANPASLRVLDLRGSGKDKLTSLPPEIGKLTNLEILRLDDNALESLPDEIAKLKKLRELHVARNRLCSLDRAAFLRSLRLVNAHGNRFTEVDHAFGEFQSAGMEVQFGGNPMRDFIFATQKLSVLGVNTEAFLRPTPPSKQLGAYPNVKEIHLYGKPLPDKELKAVATVYPNAKLKLFPRVEDGPHLVLAESIAAKSATTRKATPASSKAASPPKKLHRAQAKVLDELLAVAKRVKVEADFVREHMRPCIDLETSVAKKPLKRGATRIGGAPDLPKGTAWPKGKKGPMGFVAQIRLEDVAPYDVEGLLPKKGLLSFFQGWAEDEGRVLFFPEASKLETVTPPAKAFVDGFEEAPFRACEVTVHGAISMENLGGDEPDAWHKVMSRSLKVGKRDVLHRVAGFPFNDTDPVDRDEVVLLALGSDDKAKMTWGDDQQRYFCIARDHLAKRRFDKVRIVPATS